MSSSSSFELALHQKDEPKGAEGSAGEHGVPPGQLEEEESAPKATTTSTPTERSAIRALDPQPVSSAPELTTTSPAGQSTATSTQQAKGVRFAPHITHISNAGDSKRLPWNPFPSQTSLVPLEPFPALETENQPSFSFTSEQNNPDIRVQPSLYNLAEFLNDPTNLPSHLADQTSSSEGESSTSKPSLREQPSQLSLRQILAEGPPAPPQVPYEDISNDGPQSGLQRSVSKRVAAKVRSLVSPRSQKATGSSTNLTTTAGSAEEAREQKKDDDEHYAQSHQEAETSISLGLDGSYLFHTPTSHHTLTLTTDKPLPPLPSSKQSDSPETPPPTPSFQPRTRSRSRGATIRPSYEIIAPYLPRARTSSTETIKAGQSSATIGVMTSSADDTAHTQRIPLVCPAWDRRTDISWSRGDDLSWEGARELSAFRVSLAQFHRESKHTPTKNDHLNPLLRLPDRVRYMIAKYLVPDRADMMPIKLNNGMRLYQPVWPAVYFDDLADVLRSVRDYTSVCWAMRADILVTILNTRRFHVVLSPFSTPTFDPLAYHWFGKYAGYIQHLTIELDFSKLGFAADPAAANLKPLVTKMAPRMEEYAKAQRKRGIQQELLLNASEFFGKQEREVASRVGGRGGLSTVHSLTVAARRYFGERPAEAGRVPQKYSPDEYLAVLGPVKALCGKVDHLRAVGLDAGSAHRLLALVWEGMTAESVRQAVAGRFEAVRATCASDFYPTLPGQASYFDDGMGEGDSGRGSLVRHPFAFEDGRVGFYVDEGMVEAARKGGAHSSIPPSALGDPASKKVRGLPGLASGREKGKGKETAVWEKEQAPEWPEEMGEMEMKSRGSSTETEPFPKLPDEELQLALLAAYQAGETLRESVERCPSPERQQGEAGEEQMPGPRSSSSGGVMARMAGRLQRKISQFNPKDKDKTSKE